MQILQTLEDGWFSNDAMTGNDDKYLAGGDHPSIADFLAYEEIVQLTELGLLNEDQLLSRQFPRIYAWMGLMKDVPFYDVVHRSLVTLGDVTDDDDETNNPISKRLGIATKAGLKALMEAQRDFPTEESIPPASSKL